MLVRRAVGYDAHDGLHDEAAERAGNPDKGDARFREAEFEEVRCAVGHFDAPCESEKVSIVISSGCCIGQSGKLGKGGVLESDQAGGQEHHARRL